MAMFAQEAHAALLKCGMIDTKDTPITVKTFLNRLFGIP
jgi:hypothetical protein